MNSEERIEASDERSLDELFERYRMACPDVDPGPNFMPALWQKIEARHSFWFTFVRFGRGALTASAAVCLLLAGAESGVHAPGDGELHRRYSGRDLSRADLLHGSYSYQSRSGWHGRALAQK